MDPLARRSTRDHCLDRIQPEGAASRRSVLHPDGCRNRFDRHLGLLGNGSGRHEVLDRPGILAFDRPGIVLTGNPGCHVDRCSDLHADRPDLHGMVLLGLPQARVGERRRSEPRLDSLQDPSW